ncbi:MAG: hypothetical protein ACJ71R_07900 [Nitrososphaeraceae archaeon]
MGIFSRSWGSNSLTATGFTIRVITIAVVLLSSNFTIVNAQQSLMDQPREIENGLSAAIISTSFQSINDSFRIRVPDGWVIQDLNNTGSAMLEETTRGYGVLAQLCPGEQQQQGASLTNASDGSTNSSSSTSASICKGSDEVIHIIRYLDLDRRIPAASNTTTASNNMTTDEVLSYNLQKLQEVGYRGIHIVNSTDVRLNLTNPQTNEAIRTVPTKLVEMVYSTNFAPNEMKTGYFISTATNATEPNVGTTKGYTIFYEGNSTDRSAPRPGITTASSILPLLPPAVGQIFDSFELIGATELAQGTAPMAEIAEGGNDGADDDNDNNNDDNDNNNDDNDNNNDDNDNNNDDNDNGGRSSRGDRFADDDYDGDDDDDADSNS